jgi:hypothetical protein
VIEYTDSATSLWLQKVTYLDAQSSGVALAVLPQLHVCIAYTALVTAFALIVSTDTGCGSGWRSLLTTEVCTAQSDSCTACGPGRPLAPRAPGALWEP